LTVMLLEFRNLGTVGNWAVEKAITSVIAL
jgi:hypothetical protein